MRTIRSILRTLGFSFLLIVVWMLVLVSGTIMSDHPNDNLEYVPSDATFALRLDGRQLAETTLFSIILDSKDEEIVRLLDQALRKRATGEKPARNTGINFMTDLVAFTLPFEEYEVSGILVNVLSSRAFLKNMPELMDENQVCATNGKVGIILSSTANNKISISKKKLSLLAENILDKRFQTGKNIFTRNTSSSQFSELHFHTFAGKKEQEVSLLFEQKKQSFSFSGTIASEQTNSNILSHQLQSKGFHITNRIFANEWADSLKSSLAFLPIELPEIRAFSLNLEGCTILNHSTGFFVVPEMELVVQSAFPFSIEKALNDEAIRSDLDFSIEKNFISFQDERLYFKQLTPTSFYIGKNENPLFKESNNNQLLFITGKLEPLLSIKGGGLMTSFLEMVPIYRASKQLAQNSENLNIQIDKVNPKKAKISGEMNFKEGKSPMSEVMRFLLVGQMIK